MGTRKFTVKLSPIAEEIKKAAKELRSIRSSVDSEGKEKIKLDLIELKKCREILATRCGRLSMSAEYRGPARSKR